MRLNNFIVKSILSHNIKWTVIRNPIPNTSTSVTRNYSSKVSEDGHSEKFENVFSFSFVRYIAIFHRLKIYHIFGTSLAIPGCGLLQTMDILPEYSLFAPAYIGVTGGILLSLASLPFNNTIGFLYISEDNKYIKISSVDFWGRRKDKVILAEDWVPLLDLEPKKTDAFYLSPILTDGTKYKLFVKFGKVMNSSKMSEVIE